MRYLKNLFKALFMIINSVRNVGNSLKDILNLISFLSSDKKKSSFTITLAELDTNCMYNDIKKYINKFGDGGIGIVKEVSFSKTKHGTMRFTKVKIYKGNNSRSDLLYLALSPLLEKERNNKIVPIDEYKHRKIAAAI